MEIVGGILGLLVGGLAIGALARFALPGPDPLPLWGTIGLGLVGSFVGGTALGLLQPAGDSSTPGAAGTYFVASILGATFVLFLYRRFVQKRPLTGPEAKLHPARRRPAAPPPAGPPLLPEEEGDPLQALARLVAARDAGEVDAAEFERRKAALVARL